MSTYFFLENLKVDFVPSNSFYYVPTANRPNLITIFRKEIVQNFVMEVSF